MPPGQAAQKIVSTGLVDYLEIQIKPVFQSVMSWKIVEYKWPTIEEAFHDFRLAQLGRWTKQQVIHSPMIQG